MKLNKLTAITVLSATAFTMTVFASDGLTEREIEEGSLAGSVQVAADRYDAFDYNQDLVDQWDEPIAAVGGSSWREMQRGMGVAGMDFDAYIRSEIGEFGITSNSILVNYGGDLENEENIAYWESIGLKLEAHDIEDVNEMWRVADNAWVTLTPLSAYEDENADRKYPVLFVWHGNGNPINLAEGYGFGEEAAAKEWIVVYPWASNDDNYLAEFDRIMDELKANYPIDETRIYSTGFSKGGWVSQRLAIERPEVLAAVVSNGIPDRATEMPLMEGIDPLAISSLEGKEAIPIAFYAGEFDFLWSMDHESEEEIQGVNSWLSVHGLAADQSVEQSRNLRKFSDDPVEQQMGLKFDETETVHTEGVDYWFGKFLDENGVCVVRYTECGGAIHWPTKYMSEIAVDFLDQFAKNPETGLTEYPGE